MPWNIEVSSDFLAMLSADTTIPIIRQSVQTYACFLHKNAHIVFLCMIYESGEDVIEDKRDVVCRQHSTG